MDTLKRLARLRVSRRAGEAAPHKPLLLLVLMDMAEAGELASPRVDLTPEVSFRFTNYWSIVGARRAQRPDVRMPFHHLSGDHLADPLTSDGKPSEAKEMTKQVLLAESLHAGMHDAEWRARARRTLVKSYFTTAEQVALLEMLGLGAEEAGERECDHTQDSGAEGPRARGRNARFRQAVMSAYDFTCALTGHRLLTTTASSLVDAAHIRPFSQGGPCEVRNGLALCKNAHWAFDEGLWSITDEFTVVVSASQFQECLLPAAAAKALGQMAGRELHLPREGGDGGRGPALAARAPALARGKACRLASQAPFPGAVRRGVQRRCAHGVQKAREHVAGSLRGLHRAAVVGGATRGPGHHSPGAPPPHLGHLRCQMSDPLAP